MDFIVHSPEVEEDSSPTDQPGELAMGNARLKATAARERFPHDIILAADTIVVLDGRILGKPRDLEQAQEYLRLLSGKTHAVITGVYLAGPAPAVEESFYILTRVTFRSLSDAVIGQYLRRVEVLDKAGAYAVQEDHGMLIAGIEGCRNNVMGLPLEALRLRLCRWQKFFPELSKSASRPIEKT